MLKFKSLPILASAAALIVAIIALPAPSYATVFDVTSTNSGVGVTCSPNCGTVTVTDNGNNTYAFTVDLSSALVLHTNAGMGSNDTVAFDLTGVTGSSGPVSAPSAGPHADGFGSFDFGVSCSAVTGSLCNINGQSPSNELIFTIDAPSGQNIAANGGLALDVASASNTGNTGFAGTTPVVPAPLIGHGLLVLLAVGGVLFGGKLSESLKIRRSLAT